MFKRKAKAKPVEIPVTAEEMEQYPGVEAISFKPNAEDPERLDLHYTPAIPVRISGQELKDLQRQERKEKRLKDKGY